MFKKKKNSGTEELHEVKGAGYTATRKVKKDKTVNRRAGLHDKIKKSGGEARVKRCKPLAIKHVRRMRKVAAVASVGVVGVITVVGVGFFAPKPTTELDKELETVCYEVPTDGSKPTDHTLVENVGYLNYVLQNQEWWSSEMFSTVNAMGFSQTVETYKQYYDGVLISADVAKGFSSKATQFCVANGVVMWRPSANKDFDKMNTPWSTGEAQGMTIKTYKKNRGFPPSEFSVYVLNEETIANAYDYSVTDNGDGTFSMTLNLNVNTGVDETSADYYYKLQMKVTGDLYDCPTIHSTTLSYTFDADWRVLEFEISDSYNAAVAANLAPGCTSNTKVKFDYSEENAKNTFWNDYFSAQYDRLKDTLVDDAEVEENTDNALGYLSGAFASVLSEGAVFKLDLNIDNLDLGGVVSVEMKDGGLSGVSAKLGDILVWLDGETLYITDGSSKYKLNINGLLSTQSEGGDALGGLDIAGLMEQMTAGTFTLNEETGVATLQSEVELFGLKISMLFEFQKSENGVELNFLKAQIPLGEKTVEAVLRFGSESDKPAIPADTASYADILNDGVALDISLEVGELKLDGTAKLIMQNGGFAGVYATLGEMGVYYDCPHNMLYLKLGNAKYKLDISALGTGGKSTLSAPSSFDISSILNDVLKNLTTTENSLGSKLNINIDALESVLEAALDIQLSGGLKVNAALTLGEQNVNFTAALTNKEVTLPDLTGYEDILNGEITFDVGLTLLTGLADESGKRDEVALNGKVALCLTNGNLTEIRADFGGIAVYYEFSTNSLYLKVGTTKAMLNLAEMNFSDVSALSTLEGGNLISVDLPNVIKELLTNLVAESKTISTNLDLTVLDGIVPVWAEIDLSDGLGVKAGLTVFGIDAVVSVGLSETKLEGLSAEEKEEYIDVVKNGLSIIDSLIGEHISATVEGTIYSGEEKYAETNGVKYSFVASVEYDKGKVTVEEGVETDTKAYIHLNIGLTAPHPEDDSLYLDMYLMDANPVTGADGRTTGGYTADGSYDVYLSVSKYAENSVPLRIYAPTDEILSLVSMVCATAHLDQIKVENSKELTAAIGKIADLLDSMLISKYLPQSVIDKFASLGDSLIPQILGVSLEELLNNLFGNIGGTIQNTQNINISLSDAFVSSITATEDNLRFVLNSSLIYNKEIAAEDNLVVNFDRVLIDGAYFVDGVSLDNIFFGENEINKLNLGMKLSYGEIARPDKNTAFSGYLNAAGIDTLLNGLVNSATHSKDSATDREKEVFGAENLPDYILNHYYYLDGRLSANLNVIDIVKATVNIDLVGVSVTIDERTNDVSVNVRLHYNALTARAASADYIVINGESYVDLTIKDGMLFIKRTQLNYLEEGGTWAEIIGGIVGAAGYDLTPAKSSTPKPYSTPVVTYRVYDLNTMGSDIGGIMDLASYVLNLDRRIVKIINDEINKPDSGSSYVGTDTTGFDLGDWQNYYFKTYVYTDDNNGNASWKFTLNGAFLSDIMKMEVKDPVITFNATYVVDESGKKSYTVHNLDISEITINFVKVGSKYISMSASGAINYLNPQLVMKDGCTDETVNGSLLWEEVFGCASNEIPSSETWARALQVLGTEYLSIDTSDNNAALKLGSLSFNLAGEKFADGKKVLYTDTEVLSNFAMPEWTKKNGYDITTAFDASTVSVNASYVAKSYNVTFDFGNIAVPDEVINYVYDQDLDLSAYFGKTYSDEAGTTWKVVALAYGGVTYNAENPVIGKGALAEIYQSEVVLSVVCEEVAGDTATHVTLTSTVNFTYDGYDGQKTLLNIDFEDGSSSYAIADAVAAAEGYTFLGWWYEDNGAWRKVTGVEEFNIEGKPSFVTLEALWVNVGIDVTSSDADHNYTVNVEAHYDIMGSEGLKTAVSLSGTSYSWKSYSWGKWSNRGATPDNEVANKALKFTSSSKSSGFNAYEKWRVSATFTFTLSDGTSKPITLEQEGKF